MVGCRQLTTFGYEGGPPVVRRQVLVLDCCYSGAFPPGTLAKADADVHTLERFSGRGRTVLTASDATQYAFEGDTLRGKACATRFNHAVFASQTRARHHDP